MNTNMSKYNKNVVMALCVYFCIQLPNASCLFMMMQPNVGGQGQPTPQSSNGVCPCNRNQMVQPNNQANLNHPNPNKNSPNENNDEENSDEENSDEENGNGGQSNNSVINKINSYRNKQGKGPLTEDQKLNAAAGVQAKHMANIKQCTHDGPPGQESFVTRIQKQGASMNGAVENCAQTMGDSANSVQQWINSPGHNKNMLSDTSKVGVGSSKGSDNMNYVAMVATG